ncbi:MAG: ribonuclease Z [Candidatus Marsarchaeota archaeon]|nr:ribonuclease Z [Candidatus Marsarchaeota archaeon]
MKITFLGTSGSTPTRERSLPSVAIEREGSIFLFDCGEGTQMRLIQDSVNMSKIDAVFITHIHGDHVIGIAGLMRTLALNKRTRPLRIYIPEGYEKGVKELIGFDRAVMGYEIIINGIKGGEVFSGEGFSVSAFRLKHSVKCYGYALREEDRIRFVKERCKKLGMKGKMFAEILKKGHIKINGKDIKVGEITYTEKGRKIVYASDTRPAATTVAAAIGADILIHEATYGSELKDLAVERQHSTAEEAAGIALKAGVKRLVMVHISARYKSPAKLEGEARKIFPKSEMAKDGMAITI